MHQQYLSELYASNPVYDLGIISDVISTATKGQSKNSVENLGPIECETTTDSSQQNTSFTKLKREAADTQSNLSLEMLFSELKNSMAPGIKWLNAEPESDTKEFKLEQLDNCVTGNSRTNHISQYDEKNQQVANKSSYLFTKPPNNQEFDKRHVGFNPRTADAQKADKTGLGSSSGFQGIKREQLSDGKTLDTSLPREYYDLNELFEESMDTHARIAIDDSRSDKSKIHEYRSFCSSENSSSVSSLSPIHQDIWDVERYQELALDQDVDFSGMVENIDSLLIKQEDELSRTPNTTRINIAGPEKPETNIAHENSKFPQENQAPSVPEIDLNSFGLQLMIEALQTQSLAPIAYLLQKALSGNQGAKNGCPETVPETRQLSTQNSFDSDIYTDSDFSPESVGNAQHVWNDITFSLPPAEPCLEVLNEGNSGCLARPKRRSSADGFRQVLDKFPRTERDAEACRKEIDYFIDDITSGTEDSDIRTFEKLLDKETSNTREESSKYYVKIHKNVSTDTNNSGLDKINETGCQSRTTICNVETSKQNQNGHLSANQERKKRTRHSSLRPGPNKCYHLWDFLRDLLDSNAHDDVIHWVNQEEKEFRLVDTKRLAELWGAKKRLANMNYDKLSRSLRYYIKLDILQKVPGKRLHFRFGTGRMWRKLT